MLGFVKDRVAILRYITSIQDHRTLLFVIRGGVGEDTVSIPPLPTTSIELRNRIRAAIVCSITQDMLAKVWDEFVLCIDNRR